MNLYLISQQVNQGYDTYDSAVVADETLEEARQVDPSGGCFECGYSEWAHPDNVTACLIGKAVIGTKRGVILASFNAG